MTRYWLWGLASITAILLSITFSAEFGWDAISDDPRGFFSDWAIDWVPALATFVVAIGVLQQVIVIRRGQRTEFAPVLRLDLRLADKGHVPLANLPGGHYAAPFEDEELDWRREGEVGAEYLMLEIKNLQKHSSGSAIDVEIDVALWLPIEPYTFTFPIGHLEPDAAETHAIVNLGGLKWSSAEVIGIDFYDGALDHYSKAHGLAVMERDRDGKVEHGYIVIG